MMKMCKKHNWETQLIGEHKLGTVCTKCGILKKELDKMDNEKLIDKIANHLKEGCQGSTDYLSGINDGVYKTLHYCLDMAYPKMIIVVILMLMILFEP